MTMNRLRTLAVGTAAVVALSALGPAAAQQFQPSVPGQPFGQQPQFGQQMQQPGQQQFQLPGLQQQQGQFGQQLQTRRAQAGTLAIAGVFDVATANFAVLNEALADPRMLDRLVRGGGPRVMQQQGQQAQRQGQVRVVFLGNRLDQQQRQQVREVLSASNFIQRNASLVQTIIRQNQVLQQAVRQNQARMNQVVALDVIGQPPTIYVLSARGQGQQMQGQTQQGLQPGQSQLGQSMDQQRQGQQSGGQTGQQGQQDQQQDGQ